MASDKETVSEIVSEMNCSHELMTVFEFHNYASRIEAAHNREVAELRECLEQACGDKLGTYTMKGIEVHRWLKALGRIER